MQAVDPARSTPSDDLNDYIERFEAACLSCEPGSLDLVRFLPPRSHALYLCVLCELVRIDLEHCWDARQPRALTWYRERFPELFEDPRNRAAVAFEEFRLRRRAGENPAPADYAQRYDIDTRGWGLNGEDTRVMQANAQEQLLEVAEAYREYSLGPRAPDSEGMGLDAWLERQPGLDTPSRQFFAGLHRIDPRQAERLADGLVEMPEAGQEVFGFRLVRELGRGAFGRVFLAHQGDLANRPVALKIAPDVGSESQTLAQLQHTHIVPIYSVHRAGALQGVCMPYFGAVTLADVLREIIRRPSLPKSGLGLLSTLHPNELTQNSSRPRPEHEAGESAPLGLVRPQIERVEKMNYADAVLWFGACLADGLAHAHERGILHRDLKPANVLLTDEGQPMLLDFNLAEDVKQPAHAFRAQVGGTLPYMAPEHLRAFRGDNTRVDARSDLFSLGVLLYQMLTGRSPCCTGEILARQGASSPQLLDWIIEDRSRLPAPIARFNPSVTPACAAIVMKCLHPDPDRRYQSARELQEDLQRQLAQLPLRYAPDRNLLERGRKWVRRHPRALGCSALALVPILALLAVVIFFHFSHQARQMDERATLLAREQEAQQNLAEFRTSFPTVQFLLFTRGVPGELEEGQARCREELDRYGVLTDPDWRDRPRFAALYADDRKRLEPDLGELLYLLARAEERRNTEAKSPEEGWRERALGWIEQAVTLFPKDEVPPALWEQQIELLWDLGREEAAKAASEKAAKSPRTARALYLDAHLLTLREKPDYRGALGQLYRASSLEQRSFWIWMLLGICHENVGEENLALSCFDTSVNLAPECFGGYFQRGLMRLRCFEHARAEKDFTEVIARRPRLAEAYIQRSFARQGLEQYAGAVADLDAALELGSSAANIYALRARARSLQKDAKGAEEDYQRCLATVPKDESGWIARGRARALRDPKGALADFDEALKLNPTSRSALQNKAYVLDTHLHLEKQSLAVLDKLIAAHPSFAPAHIGRGVLRARAGQRQQAHEDADRAIFLDPRPIVRYQAGCIYALTSRQVPADASAALLCLRTAVAQGFGREYLETDHDLDPLRQHPDFQRWLAELRR
jgi:serine/threonine protein kinase/Flp pilus assembly protein TadD